MTGFIIYKDYGISVDEVGYRHQGIVVLHKLSSTFLPEFTNKVKGENLYATVDDVLYTTALFSGVPFHYFAAFLEYIFKFENKENIFYFKHLLTFLFFFIGAIFFYFLLILRFKEKKIAITGTIFLIFSPRIFADSFYSPNDIVFMVLTIILCYFFFKYFVKFSLKYLLLIAFFTSISIGMRPMAIYLPFIFILYLFFCFLNKKITLIFFIKNLFLLLILTLLLSFIVNPVLWNDPIKNFISPLKFALSSNVSEILYMGKFYPNTELPWHYLIVWIFITTPVLYLILFLIGITKTIIKIRSSNLFKIKKDLFFDLLIITLFLLPFFSAIFFSKSLLNSWRHLFFIYPLILFVSIIGLEFILKNLLKKIIVIFYSLIIVSLAFTGLWMYLNHPFQMVYFNILAGNNLQDKFELDYWGLSNKTAIQYILKNDHRDKIKIAGVSNTRLNYTLFLFDKKSKDRIKLVQDSDQSDYVISIYNDKIRRNDMINKKYKIFHEIKVDSYYINSIFIK